MTSLAIIALVGYGLVGFFNGRVCAGKSYYGVKPWTGDEGSEGTALLAFAIGFVLWPFMLVTKLARTRVLIAKPRSVALREREQAIKEAERELGIGGGLS